MGARRNADADAVGLEFLLAREARHRQLVLGERQRGHVGIVAHVGDDAGDHGGLARLVLADRGVLGQHMGHLVAQHRGQFRGVAGQRDQAARHIELAGRQREGVDRAGIEDRHLVGLVGTIGGRHQPVDGLADQGLELRIVIGAAIGRQDALMLALGGGRLRDGAASAGLAGALGVAGDAVWNRCRGRRSRPSAEVAHSTDGRSPKAAAHPVIAPSRTPLTPYRHSDLRRANSRPARSICPTRSTSIRGPPPRLDPAADPNPSDFRGT